MKLAVLLLILVVCEAKVFKRCNLAKELKKLVNKTFLPSYVCLIEKVSNKDTNLVTEESNKKKYGLYQIPQIWCKDNKPGGHCNIACELLLDDDIRDDTECAKQIVKQEGFKYWSKYDRCKDDLIFFAQEIKKCPQRRSMYGTPEETHEVIASDLPKGFDPKHPRLSLWEKINSGLIAADSYESSAVA